MLDKIPKIITDVPSAYNYVDSIKYKQALNLRLIIIILI